MSSAGDGNSGPQQRRFWRHPIVLVALAYAVAARVLYLLANRGDPVSSYLLHDARRYHEWAGAIAAGTTWESGAYYQAPLYPYLVALVYRLFGAVPAAVEVLQAVLGVLTVLLVAKIAHRAYGATASAAAATLTALYGPLVFFETKLLSAALAVFFSALLIDRLQVAITTDRSLQWWVSGLVQGSAILTNPSFILMAILTNLWIGFAGTGTVRRKLRSILFFLFGVGLLMAPVTLRNHRASGDWVLVSTNGGLTFAHGNNPNALGVFSTPPGISGRIEDQRQESRALAELATGRPMSDADVSGYWFRYGTSYLAANPLRAVELLGRKALLALASEEQPLEYNQRLNTNPMQWLFPLPFALLLGLAVARPAASSSRNVRPDAEVPILLSLLAGAITLVGFYVAGRYRLPAVPALAAVAGGGSQVLIDRAVRGKGKLGLVLAGTISVTALSLAYVPLTHQALRRQQEAMAWVDRAAALWGAGRQDEAIAALRRSIELDPELPGPYLSLGRALARNGKQAEAEEALVEALRCDPSLAAAHFELGVLLLGSQRPEEAAAAFAEAFRLEPDNAHAANNLLGTLVHLGRAGPARALLQEIQARKLSVDPGLIDAVSRLEVTDP